MDHGFQRIPPHCLDAERSVLGGILLQNEAIDAVVEIVEREDFYSEANATIYECILALYRCGTPVDTVTLRESLARSRKLQSVGGDAYVLGLTDTIPAIENIRAHATIVREKSLVRRLLTTCHSILARGYDDYGTAHEFIDHAEKSLYEVARLKTHAEVVFVRDIMIRAFEELQALALSGERVAGLKTGFDPLDELTAGMHPGDLIIVAGRPGMGKTSFAMNVAVNACRTRLERGKPAGVAVFSLEMPKEQILNRLLASEARLCSQRLRNGHIERRDWQKLASTAETLSQLPIMIDDKHGLTVMELRAKARRLMSKHGLALVIIDYLQLMRSGTKADRREQEISEISRELKGLAKDLRIPVIALSQLNRGVESRTNKDKRPQLSDLRESGAIEQDADTILFVYRDEVYNRETTERGVAEVIVGKQRAGPTGIVKLRFLSHCVRFENPADHALEPSGSTLTH